jgi:putative transposase
VPKSKHSEAAIIAALQQLDPGRKAADVAREVGVSTYTIYAWKAKYGGMDVSQTQETKQLREENARLKKLVADLSLDKDASIWQAAGRVSCWMRQIHICAEPVCAEPVSGWPLGGLSGKRRSLLS